MNEDLKPYNFSKLTLNEVVKDLAVRFVLNCPPEDLSTSVRLMFQVEEAWWFYLDFVHSQNESLPPFRKLRSFVEQLYRSVPVMSTIFEDPLLAVNEFGEYKRGIPVRGGIILNEAMDKILLVRAWKMKSWGFPRGKINKGEDDLVCAIREVLEETGFDMTAFVDRRHFAERTIEGKSFLMFYATGVPESTHFETRTREEIAEIQWVPLRGLATRSTYKSYIVPAFLRDIERFVHRNRGKRGLLGQDSHDLKRLLGIDKAAAATPAPTVSTNAASTSGQRLLDMIKAEPTHDKQQTTQATTQASTDQTSANRPASDDPSRGLSMPFGSAPIPMVLPGAYMRSSYMPQFMYGYGGSASYPVSETAAQEASEGKVADAEAKEDAKEDIKETNTSAKQMLALLNSTASSAGLGTDSAMGSRASSAVPSATSSAAPSGKVTPTEDDFSLPQNDILERLVSSRRNHTSRHQSTLPARRPQFKQNALLQVLHAKYPKQAKGSLLDLLEPATSKGPSRPARDPNQLMKLLGTTSLGASSEVADAKPLGRGTRPVVPDAHGDSLLALLAEDARRDVSDVMAPTVPQTPPAHAMQNGSEPTGAAEPDHLEGHPEKTKLKKERKKTKPKKVEQEKQSLMDLLMADAAKQEANADKSATSARALANVEVKEVPQVAPKGVSNEVEESIKAPTDAASSDPSASTRENSATPRVSLLDMLSSPKEASPGPAKVHKPAKKGDDSKQQSLLSLLG